MFSLLGQLFCAWENPLRGVFFFLERTSLCFKLSEQQPPPVHENEKSFESVLGSIRVRGLTLNLKRKR